MIPLYLLTNPKNIFLSQKMICERPFVCNTCGASFALKGGLVRHISTSHSEDRPYTCWCGSSFKRTDTLATHTRSHNKDEYFTCDKCGKVLYSQSGYRDHVNIYCDSLAKRRFTGADFGDRSYVCSECGAGFTTNNTLYRHMATHSTTRSFRCKVCSKAFKTKSNLKVHSKIHTDRQRLPCKLCGKMFINASTLARHKKLHKVNKSEPKR